MKAHLTFELLKEQVRAGEIDTVLACIVDMQGRLMGKRFHGVNFIEHSFEETHCCDYLLATDIEMGTPDGYASSSWTRGYGDFVMKPDLSTLRPLPWLDGTVMVLCDLYDHHTHELVPHAPRAVLKRQVERLKALGYDAMMATELEFFLFEKDYDTIRRGGFLDLTPISAYNEDYNIFQTTKEEVILRDVRNGLYGAGIPVENSKGEAETGQEELNIRYSNPNSCAEHHTIAKHAVKEISWMKGHAASFMAKWSNGKVGSSSHVHQSLWKDGKPAFYDADAPLGKSRLMDHYMAGLIRHAPEITFFLAPYINSYKRFEKGTFAPTKIAWSIDNRTAGFRLCGEGTKGVRVECRIGGSDINPYLGEAALLAAGIKGIEDELTLEDATTGDVYESENLPEIPNTLREATENLRNSAMLREAMGDDVIDHYTRCAEVEQESFDKAVTDWEIRRGFERS